MSQCQKYIPTYQIKHKTSTHSSDPSNKPLNPHFQSCEAIYTTMSNTTQITKGSSVEVCSNDPGFEGAWYVGTLIDQLNPNPNPNQPKYIIKYDTLLKDDGSNDPLTETVDPSFVRPLPPRNLRRNNIKTAAVVVAAADVEGKNDGGGGGEFEMYDVVDAYHREGWWIGVVKKVVVNNNIGGGRRYVVGFENPPEEVEFGRGQLRLHVDWVDGRWRVPPKKIPKDVLLARKAKLVSESNNDARSDLATPSKGAQTTDADSPTVDPLLSSLKKSLSKKNTEGNAEMGAVEASDPSKKNKRVTTSVEQDSRGKRFQSSAGVENIV
ncbi:hypothetical protein M8C21_018680 [Ambrosia artemisiifolia]|uniref:Agenet domain-containing protein n=1 Tax=Ambrosia artemisiifolia TaxID=4212 RepID=A0AAD5GYT2_AMBAR|nr:hypothetical protein M8C21_018680 [Ambrosia artemisiifolia]